MIQADWRGKKRDQAKNPYVRWGAKIEERNAALRALFPEGSTWEYLPLKGRAGFGPWKVRYVDPHGHIVMDLVSGTGITFLYPYEEGPDEWRQTTHKGKNND